jgi:glycosyltransferase involved in cell wall biosynthesis
MLRRPLIAIDATSVPPQPAGAGRYTLSLIQALSRVDREHDYAVYARSHSLPGLQGLAPSFRVIDVGALSRAKRYLWEQTALPLDLRRRGARLLHSPHHTTPLVCPCPRVVTVHDVTFFLLPQRYPRIRRYYFQLATRLSVRQAAAVIVPSRSAANDLDATLHPPTAKVHVTHEGVDAAFRPASEAEIDALRERYGLPAGYLLSLGTV